jgi:hypothetical protein
MKAVLLYERCTIKIFPDRSNGGAMEIQEIFAKYNFAFLKDPEPDGEGKIREQANINFPLSITEYVHPLWFRYIRPGENAEIDIGVLSRLPSCNRTEKDECNDALFCAEFLCYRADAYIVRDRITCSRCSLSSTLQ